MINSILLIRPFAAEKKQFPLGLLYVGTALKRKGYQIQIIDLQDEPERENEIIETLKSRPDMLLGISALAPQYHWVKRFTLRLKQIIPQTPVVIGGHIAICRKQLLENTGIDYVCVGEGEEMLPELVEALNSGSALENIAGMAYRGKDGVMLKTAWRPQIKDFGLPDYDLINVEKYIIHPDEDSFFHKSAEYQKQATPQDKSCVIMFSRGCIGHCGFCYRHHAGYRQLTIEESWENLMILYHKYGVRYFRIDDELFTNNPEWLKAICEKIRESGLGIMFRITGLRVDTVDDERLEMLKRSGCIAINYGIESLSQTTLNTMLKGVSVQQNEDALRKTLAHGMATMAYIIWGYQGENKKTILETIDTLISLGLPPHLVSIFYLVALPGTTMYAYALRTKKITDEDAYLDSLNILMQKWGGFHKRYLINYSELSRKELKKYEEMLMLILKLRVRFGKNSILSKIVRQVVPSLPASLFLGLTNATYSIFRKTKSFFAPKKPRAPKKPGSPLCVLCLSFRTPPAVRPQAILIGKMIPEWIRQGVQPVIVNYDNNGDWGIDVPIYSVPFFRINRFAAKLPFVREALEYIYLRRLCRKLKPIIREHEIDLIFSFANPQASNALGAMLKKQTHLPFVAHFSDPWYDMPLEKKSWASNRLVRAWEKYVIKNSDRVIFVNPILRDLVMKKYPSAWTEKTSIIPHCFDPKLYAKVEKLASHLFLFGHIGAFYEQRRPEPLLEVMSKVKKAGINDFRLELVGADQAYTGFTTKELGSSIQNFGLADTVAVKPAVDYIESLKLMSEADCLLVMDANLDSSPFLPSKLIDYAGSGTIIVGFTPQGSPTQHFLDKLGYRSFSYQQLDQAAQYLADLVQTKKQIIPNREYLEAFGVERTTSGLIDIFKQAQKR